MKKHSAGLLVYRLKNGLLEVLLAHPGGPFWAKKDLGVWSIPKGEFEANEDPMIAARREFEEEIGQPAPNGQELTLDEVKRRDGRLIKAWAVEGDLDVTTIKSNTIFIDWPPRSTEKMEIPEIDRAGWFDLATASRKMHDVQVPLLAQLAHELGQEIKPPPPDKPDQQSLL